MKRTSVFRQILVYIKKNARLFFNQKDWRFIVIAGVISFLVCSIVGEDMFTTYESTKSGFFTIVSAAIWIGIFNSIQGICKEHATIRSEYRSGLHISSYILAHVIFDFAVCLCQTILLMAIFCFYVDFPTAGLIFDHAAVEYFITFFLIIWSSDILGIMVSSVSSAPNVAMTIMPFVLIIQLIMSGVLFELSGITEQVATITISKWGMSALGSIADLNSDSLPLALSSVYPFVFKLTTNPEYDAIADNLYRAWGYTSVISAASVVISIISLKFRNRNS